MLLEELFDSGPVVIFPKARTQGQALKAQESGGGFKEGVLGTSIGDFKGLS